MSTNVQPKKNKLYAKKRNYATNKNHYGQEVFSFQQIKKKAMTTLGSVNVIKCLTSRSVLLNCLLYRPQITHLFSRFFFAPVFVETLVETPLNVLWFPNIFKTIQTLFEFET